MVVVVTPFYKKRRFFCMLLVELLTHEKWGLNESHFSLTFRTAPLSFFSRMLCYLQNVICSLFKRIVSYPST